MINLFYHILMRLSQRWGLWIFYMAAWTVATGYFLFFPRRVAVSARFYRALFPGRAGWYAICCAWKQFHGFIHPYLDRFLLETSGQLNYTKEGWDELDAAIKGGNGGVLLMSHLGNWDVAAHLLKKEGAPLLLFMGQKEREQIEATQKEGLRKSGVEVIASQADEASPLQILEGARAIRNGWLISMAADRARPGQSTVAARFLNHTVELPETPFALAVMTGAPLYVFFGLRTGRQRYHFVIYPPIRPGSGGRRNRKQRIRQAAQAYAAILEETVRQYPFQWHHFEPFLDKKS